MRAWRNLAVGAAEGSLGRGRDVIIDSRGM